jgi:hypothetical protein
MPHPPVLEPICDLEIDLTEITEIGPGRAGQRRIIPITGGRVSGSHFSGEILNIGADWQTIFHDGVAELDARYAFRTDDGAIIEVHNQGYRHGPAEVLARLALGEPCDPASYYMRTTARMETGATRYGWVNRLVFVGSGERLARMVRISLFAVR